ncbi:MAG: transcription antitermination factor NusB [Bacteroidota bacterium]
MLNRRHLRIKILQMLYAYYQSGEENLLKFENELLSSIERMYDLYLVLLLTMPELVHAAENRLEDKKKKLRPSEEDLNPNLKFVNNRVFKKIKESQSIIKSAELRKANWIGAEKQEIFRKLFLQIQESELYFEYMNEAENSFENDKSFAVNLFKSEIANSELLHNFFEEASIHWMDDLDHTCSMVLKTIKASEENGEFSILPLYKPNDSEKEFVVELFRKTIAMNSENESLIDELTKNWELDRIAKMDIILLKMGVTELQIFPEIPTKVTLNETIEISKYYSTPKSNTFINGILDKAIERLKKDKKIVKIGRGLLN